MSLVSQNSSSKGRSSSVAIEILYDKVRNKFVLKSVTVYRVESFLLLEAKFSSVGLCFLEMEIFIQRYRILFVCYFMHFEFK